MLDFGKDYGPAHARSAESHACLAAACERARLFLASFGGEGLSLADARQAAELRHRLRAVSPHTLQEAVCFAAGLCPEHSGQKAFGEAALADAAVRSTRRLPVFVRCAFERKGEWLE